jgi:hypothetical protein
MMTPADIDEVNEFARKLPERRSELQRADELARQAREICVRIDAQLDGLRKVMGITIKSKEAP